MGDTRTRAQAIQLRQLTYTGKPCAKCGTAARYTKSSNCVRCMKERVNASRIALRELWRQPLPEGAE